MSLLVSSISQLYQTMLKNNANITVTEGANIANNKAIGRHKSSTDTWLQQQMFFYTKPHKSRKIKKDHEHNMAKA